MAVLHRNAEVLLCHRHPDREWYPDVWDLPGGHVEANETERAALVREVREELGIDIELDGQPLAGVSFGNVDASVWASDTWTGRITNASPNEHDAIEWFAVDELETLALADPAVSELCRLAIGSVRTPPPHGSEPR